ncbi:MAG: HAD family hydrolase [Sulfuritalea sp.]|nr:HAD family hydrolase [Sulfuritalea sp.]
MTEASFAVVWDLDDTLLDTSTEIIPRSHLAAATAMVEAGLNATIEEIHAYRMALAAQGAQGIDHLTASRFGGSISVANAGERAFLSTDVGFVPVAAPVIEMLRRLRPRVEHHLLTVGNTQRQIAKCHYGFDDDLFSSVHVLSPSHSMSKLAILQCVADCYGGPQRVIAVGDRPDAEISAANTLGMTSIRVRTGEHSRREIASPLEMATHVVHDILLVEELINSFLASSENARIDDF